MEIETRKLEFVRKFGDGGDIRGYFAPGRVNLIGEHIDYNGGHVFPCALSVGTFCIARKREDRFCRFYSFNCKRAGVPMVSLDRLSYNPDNGWTNYPLGVMWTFRQKGRDIPYGFDIFIYGNIPGSGLSSSASREVVIGVRLKDRYGFDVSRKDIAVIGQYSENVFNNVNCGIRDQFASARGKADQAIYLDCSTLEYQYIPFALDGITLVVINSNKPHSLSQSHYNERRKECDEALKYLRQKADIRYLCELTPEQFESYKSLIPDEVLIRRAKHAVYEEQRTKDAIVALNNKDYDTFGRLRNESGDSLRYDYEATCFEIDTLVDAARLQKGVYGSRITGGGWGGNTVSLVKDEFLHPFVCNVGQLYKNATGRKAKFTFMKAGDGGHRIF